MKKRGLFWLTVLGVHTSRAGSSWSDDILAARVLRQALRGKRGSTRLSVCFALNKATKIQSRAPPHELHSI